MSVKQIVPSVETSHRDAINSAGVVIIGRNEGERLRRCLQSVVSRFQHAVYVDSASTDGSTEYAASIGLSVVSLDRSTRFTAARARNAGFVRLEQIEPDMKYVQFIDGDCELDATWPAQAIAALEHHPALAVVCGRRRERALHASLLNRLIDVEWDTPVGYVDSCGGDAMVRVSAFAGVGGFDASLMAGEEPELCFRLRKAGWRILRLDAAMTLHDAALRRLSQWWKREIRTGYGAHEVWCRCGSNREAPFHHLVRSSWIWAVGWPFVTLITALWFVLAGHPRIALAVAGALLLAGCAQALKISVDGRRKNLAWRDAIVYGALAFGAKFAQTYGGVVWRWQGNRSVVIEYKQIPIVPVQRDNNLDVGSCVGSGGNS
jgi:GT2 family glycosyltransferase